MQLENKILINNEILVFYRIPNGQLYDEKFRDKVIDSQLCLNYKEIIRLIWPMDFDDENKVNKHLEGYGYKEYLESFEILLPVFQCAKSILIKLNNEKYSLRLYWIENNIECWKLYTHITKDTPECSPLHTLESILCLTALLENALANVYNTVNEGRKVVPHLLKDLIASEELKNLFGWETMVFLKIFLGTPNSINLRNICWHGFPPINGIPDVYHAVLLLIIHSLGLKLGAMEFHVTLQRVQVKDFSNYLEHFPEELKSHNFDLQYCEQQLNHIYAEFNETYLPIWRKLLHYYTHKFYVPFVILMLPQIELILRLYYGQINQCNVEAKIDEYYITLDTIFAAEVQSVQKEFNKLLNFTWSSRSEGCFKLMYDLFLSPNGCRLRDKVSHGEVYLEALNNSKLTSILLHLFLNLLLSDVNFSTISNYESHLHLNCQTQMILRKTFRQIKEIKNPEILWLEKGEQLSSRLDFHVLIFQRPTKERELMLNVKKITENTYQILFNCVESLDRSSQRLHHRKLHSRQRNTLQNLSVAFPRICNNLIDILEAVCIIFILIQRHTEILFKENYVEKTTRFLKRLLTISENLLKYSNPDVNQWIKMLELCNKFKEYKEHYCINEIMTQYNEIQNNDGEYI